MYLCYHLNVSCVKEMHVLNGDWNCKKSWYCLVVGIISRVFSVYTLISKSYKLLIDSWSVKFIPLFLYVSGWLLASGPKV